MFIRYFLGNSQTKDKLNRELFSTKTSEEDWYSGNKAEVKEFFINWNKKDITWILSFSVCYANF